MEANASSLSRQADLPTVLKAFGKLIHTGRKKKLVAEPLEDNATVLVKKKGAPPIPATIIRAPNPDEESCGARRHSPCALLRWQ